MQFEIHFTLAEANALLPWVRRVLRRVHDVAALLPEEFHLNMSDPPEQERAAHKHSLKRGLPAWAPDVAAVPAEAALDEAVRRLKPEEKLELIGGLLQGLVEKGIVIQDVGRGLIDFPAQAGGSEVLLCYELADGERIVAWHDLQSGYAGRQPIAELPE